jgi:hypothetical protein
MERRRSAERPAIRPTRDRTDLLAALVLMAPIPRVRARGARRWRRELGGGVQQHPGSNNWANENTRHRKISSLGAA